MKTGAGPYVRHLPRNLACLTNAAIAIVRCKGRFRYLPEANRHYAARAQDALDTNPEHPCRLIPRASSQNPARRDAPLDTCARLRKKCRSAGSSGLMRPSRQVRGRDREPLPVSALSIISRPDPGQ